jgi:hypothetical protein
LRSGGDISRRAAGGVCVGLGLLLVLTYWVGIATVDLGLTRGHVIGGDGLLYYEYLPELLGGDALDFESGREALQSQSVPYFWDAPYLQCQATGRLGTVFSFGWALLVLPFFAVAHLLALASGTTCAPPGYGFLYESMTNFGAVFYGLTSLHAFYKTARLALDRRRSLLCATLAFLGTNAVYYSLIQAPMAHGVGMSCVAYGTHYWLRAVDTGRRRHAVLCALAFFLGTLVRPQLALAAAGAACHLVWTRRSIAPAGDSSSWAKPQRLRSCCCFGGSCSATGFWSRRGRDFWTPCGRSLPACCSR